jgi:catechol 2,3-dioxygenase-like lactoylglutathione lyase family enzyme
VNINGIAHIQLTVSDVARSKAFWAPLFALFEMKIIFDDPSTFYGVGGRTGVLLRQHDDKGAAFSQANVGLHHFCFRLRSREDVDELHAQLVQSQAKIVHAPEEGPWANGYYSVLFEDPDGIRVEANFVPGKGNLDPSVVLPKSIPL